MAKKVCTDEEFITIWREHQSPDKVGKAIGLSTRNTLKLKVVNGDYSRIIDTNTLFKVE